MVPTFKVILVGEGGVGKTTLVHRHLHGDFKATYSPTIGVEVHPLRFTTSAGQICFNIWDCAGREELGGLREGYYLQAQAAIVMFDVTDQESYDKVGGHVQNIRRQCGDIPIVLCGSKVDSAARVVQPKAITIHRSLHLQYYDVSAKSNYQFDRPFLHLAQVLLADASLTWSEEQVLAPPEALLA